ncbi:MAG: C40 family peptidase [Candidatus Accumulibacter sp.]|jgi:cell wall-associated NlpC family hydrolase|nr:C40 family peptidase [Accumulibacter sp.]
MRNTSTLSSLRICVVWLAVLSLAACGGLPSEPSVAPHRARVSSEKGRDVVLFAMGLIDVAYRFGGKNPEAGLDCSGMVSYVYREAIGLNITGRAVDIARKGRSIGRGELRPGDLVFFNTLNAPFSHVGIYIGEERFIHAPSTNSRVRIESMRSSYYAKRFHAARAYFDD